MCCSGLTPPTGAKYLKPRSETRISLPPLFSKFLTTTPVLYIWQSHKGLYYKRVHYYLSEFYCNAEIKQNRTNPK